MKKQKKKKGGLFLAGMVILGLLCVAFIVGDLYLFMLARQNSQEDDPAEATQTTQTAQTEQVETATASEQPQIIVAAQPESTQEAQPTTSAEETAPAEAVVEEAENTEWQNDWVSFSYQESAMWVTEDNGVVMVTDPQFSDLPRMDLQQLTGADELTQQEFEILAKAAVRAYFSAEPSADLISVTAVTQTEGGWTAELTLSETDVSPALHAWVRLTNQVLASMLLPQTADEETQTAWMEMMESVSSS